MSHDTNDSGETSGFDRGTSTVEHTWEEPFQPSVSVVEAVSAATDRTPTELPPLHDHVDPDALDTLISRGESSAVTISFSYAGTVVVIDGDGTISVRVDGEQ